MLDCPAKGWMDGNTALGSRLFKSLPSWKSPGFNDTFQANTEIGFKKNPAN